MPGLRTSRQITVIQADRLQSYKQTDYSHGIQVNSIEYKLHPWNTN